MVRRQLNADIEVLDQQLQYQHWVLQTTGRQRLARLRLASPLSLLGGGFAAGLLAGHFAAPSYRLYGIYRQGFRLWTLAGALLSLTGSQGQNGGEL